MIGPTFWIPVLLVMVLLDLFDRPKTALIVFLGAMAVELYTGVNSVEGDTLSETVWMLLDGRPGLIPAAVGLAVWLVWIPIRTTPGALSIRTRVGFNLGLATLGNGVALTLAQHFVFLGRFG